MRREYNVTLVFDGSSHTSQEVFNTQGQATRKAKRLIADSELFPSLRSVWVNQTWKERFWVNNPIKRLDR